MSAPFSNKISTTLPWPFNAATYSGVFPSTTFILASAPFSSKISTKFPWPEFQTNKNVDILSKSNDFIQFSFKLPWNAAPYNAVLPQSSLILILIPVFKRDCTTLAWPESRNQSIFHWKMFISPKMHVIFLHWPNCLNGEYQNYHSVLQCKVLFCLRQLSHLRRLHTAIKHPQLFHCLHEEDEGVYFMVAWNIFAIFTTLPIWAAHNNGVHPLLSFWSILAPFFNKISTTFAYPKLSFERFVFD